MLDPSAIAENPASSPGRRGDCRWARRSLAAVLVSGGLLLASCAAPGPRADGAADSLPDRTAEISLQGLIDAAADGESVAVPAGRYVLTEPLVIRGRQGLTVAFGPPAEVLLTDPNRDVVRIEDSAGITLRGALVRHLEPLAEYQCHGAVVEVSRSETVTIDDCTLNGSGAIGVSARQVRDLTIQHCVIERNSFNALCLTDCSGVRVFDCVIRANANFLQADGLNDVEFSGNVIHDNGGYWREPEPAGRRTSMPEGA